MEPASWKKATLSARPSATWRSMKKLAALTRAGTGIIRAAARPSGDPRNARPAPASRPACAREPAPWRRRRPASPPSPRSRPATRAPRGATPEGIGRVDPVREVAREQLLPRLHEALDVGRVGEEGLEADDLAHAGAGRLEHRPHVLEGLPGLGHHVAGADQRPGAARAHLSRHHHQLAARRDHPVRLPPGP